MINGKSFELIGFTLIGTSHITTPRHRINIIIVISHLIQTTH